MSDLEEVKNTSSEHPREVGNKGKSKKRKKQNEDVIQSYEDNIEVKTSKSPKKKCVKVNQESTEQSDSCIEVLGRKTRLKKINKPSKSTEDMNYETEEFMAFSNKTDYTIQQDFKGFKRGIRSRNNNISNGDRFTEYVDPNKENTNLPKQLVFKEYRLVMAKLGQLKIVPPEVKVIIKDAVYLPEATRKKLKLFYKSKRLKTLLPPDDKVEIEVAVQKCHEQLQPKITMMNTLLEMEERTGQLAQELSEKYSDSTTIQDKAEAGSEKMLDSVKIKLLKNMSDQLQLLLGNEKTTSTELDSTDTIGSKDSDSKMRRNEDNPAANSEGKKSNLDTTHKKNRNEQFKGESNTISKSLTQIRLEEKLECLAKQMKRLIKGKIPKTNKTLQSVRGIGRGNVRRSFNKYAEQSDTNIVKEGAFGGNGDNRMRFENGDGQGIEGTTLRSVRGVSFSQGRYNHRGRGEMIGSTSVPLGGWGIIQSFGGGFQKGNSQEIHGFTNFSGRSQFVRGRGGRGFRGRSGGNDFLKRGRISQNNFDAKRYAEKCKAEKKMPELNFNGVDLKAISGYAASVPSSSNPNTDSKSISRS